MVLPPTNGSRGKKQMIAGTDTEEASARLGGTKSEKDVVLPRGRDKNTCARHRPAARMYHLFAEAALQTIDDMVRQCLIIVVEMMAAVHGDDFGAGVLE